jgi:hypothetical protein
MTLLTGFYMMIARFLATLAIDLEAAPVDWSQSDSLNEGAYVSRMLTRSAEQTFADPGNSSVAWDMRRVDIETEREGSRSAE